MLGNFKSQNFIIHTVDTFIILAILNLLKKQDINQDSYQAAREMEKSAPLTLPNKARHEDMFLALLLMKNACV